jgi:leucyl-tRNA synthetase
VAALVEGALKHFDGDRYELLAWCVMPNHVHAIFRPLGLHDPSAILHSWKSFTANKANETLRRSGEYWQKESYDHIIRDEAEFLQQIRYVIANPEKAGLGDWKWVGTTKEHRQDAAATAVFTGEGKAVNSQFLDGLSSAEAKKKIIAWLKEKGLGQGTINYKLRDWLFSRQRYWGEPFPIIWEANENGKLKHRALDEKELPVVQPDMDDFKPTGTAEPPLSKATEWLKYSEKATRETNTMPQWAGSCWYYLRFCDPKNSDRFIGRDAESFWMAGEIESQKSKIKNRGGVDLYVGGTEHAVLHLLYARFWHKVLFDLGFLTTPEPFQRLVNQGIILGPDNQKMSKSRGNVVTPDTVIEEYGADSLRLYEMFMGPLEQMKPWSMKGVEGVYRFLGRVWRLAMEETQEGNWKISPDLKEIELTSEQLRVAHATIKKVTADVDDFAFNTAISQMMVFTNEFVKNTPRPVAALKILLPLLSPFAPHLAEELWEHLGKKFPEFQGRASAQPWPAHDEKHLLVEEVELVVQINGKLRDRIKAKRDAVDAELEKLALASPKVQEATTGKEVVKVIVIKGKLINIVVK